MAPTTHQTRPLQALAAASAPVTQPPAAPPNIPVGFVQVIYKAAVMLALKGLAAGAIYGFVLSCIVYFAESAFVSSDPLVIKIANWAFLTLLATFTGGVSGVLLGGICGALLGVGSVLCWSSLARLGLAAARHWALYRASTGAMVSLLACVIWFGMLWQILPNDLRFTPGNSWLLAPFLTAYMPGLVAALAFWQSSGRLAFWYAQAKGSGGGARLLYADNPDLYDPDLQQTLFERLQPSYQRAMFLLSASQDQRLRSELVKLMDLQPGMRVADLMSGGGEMWAHVLPHVGPNGGIVALERSPAMLRAAQERQQREYLTQVELRLGDALKSGLPSASFDAVVCAFGAALLTPLQRMALADEIQRLLGEHGIFGIVDLCWPQETAARVDYQFYLRRLAPLVSPALLVSPRHVRLLAGYLDRGGNGGDLEGMLRLRGLQVYRYPLLGGRAVALVGMKIRSLEH